MRVFVRLRKVDPLPVPRVVTNAVSLYAVQVSGYILPLVTVPYLTRVLGPEGFGKISFAQSLSLWASIIIEFGFNLSGTRLVVLHREDHGRLAELAADIMGAKLLLSTAVVALFLFLGAWIPLFRNEPGLMIWVLSSTLAMGFSPAWYFQGTERLALVSALEVALRAVSVLLIFWLVRDTGDAWRYLALNASASLLTTAITLWMVYREVDWRWPRITGALRTIRSNWGMGAFRGVEQLYTSANAFLLGLLAPSQAVGYFSGAERLAKAGVSLMGPLSQALYPYMNRLVATDRDRAQSLVHRLVVVLGGLGAAAAAGGMLLAPWVVPLVLGQEYGPSVLSFRWLVWLVPLRGVNSVLTMQWLFPHGRESLANLSMIGATCASLLLALVLVPRLGHVGMAIAAVAAEVTALVFLLHTARAAGQKRTDLTGRRGA